MERPETKQEIAPFQDKAKSLKGIKILLNPKDPLVEKARQGFLSRSMEVGEILRWAEERRIQLLEEFYVEVPRENQGEGEFKVVTYSHILHPQEEPAPKRTPKRTLTEKEEGIEMW